MKNAFIVLAYLLISISCVAQEKAQQISNSGLPKEFFRRWKLDYGTADGSKIDLSQAPHDEYEFKQNGKYVLYIEDGSLLTGTWEYDEKEKVVYTKRDDGELNGRITEIKPGSITLVPDGKGISGTMFEKFKFYYKPN
ncbi:hypothetical protein [Hymenobacter lapidiphilus]|uniref:Lipocalin-like domain-containing protein n=1 Tax=Hymenobacter lapidiphilus TaxID=2608003 RepID=A0A7Y7PPU2_9BACT|nr:hypothetical protein [Hymenobacter lapidiphilus]NVO31778.1 hypothetical protein [Hymenobacter lapidiphilus]